MTTSRSNPQPSGFRKVRFLDMCIDVCTRNWQPMFNPVGVSLPLLVEGLAGALSGFDPSWSEPPRFGLMGIRERVFDPVENITRGVVRLKACWDGVVSATPNYTLDHAVDFDLLLWSIAAYLTKIETAGSAIRLAGKPSAPQEFSWRSSKKHLRALLTPADMGLVTLVVKRTVAHYAGIKLVGVDA